MLRLAPRACSSVGRVQVGGTTVLLTGASGGIGQAVARTLRARGARVLLSGRRAGALEQLRAELGGGAEVLEADLGDAAGAAGLAARAGAVDVLVANAGLPASGPLVSFTPGEIDRALDVNLRAPIQLTRALVPGMVERGRGHVVLVSSLAGKVASVGSAVYSATKFGLRGFAAGLREDVHGSGVGVTVVFPSFIRDAGMYAQTEVELPRWVGTRTPDDVARAVVRGIETGKAEIDVAPLSLRLGAVASAVAPRSAARLQRRLGSVAIAEAIAREQRAKR
ncbi:MAG: SDR family NAD(P)-dependent oxidoreductase [Thermoleophilaceae bacterium]|nr:SDR family NAD(P)-dependent oxidoreductase [Thermoleophilaceae bacterium]